MFGPEVLVGYRGRTSFGAARGMYLSAPKPCPTASERIIALGKRRGVHLKEVDWDDRILCCIHISPI